MGRVAPKGPRLSEQSVLLENRRRPAPVDHLASRGLVDRECAAAPGVGRSSQSAATRERRSRRPR